MELIDPTDNKPFYEKKNTEPVKYYQQNTPKNG